VPSKDPEVYKEGHAKRKCVDCGKNVHFSRVLGITKRCRRCRDKRKSRF